jgi:DNA-binding protein YbaB
MSTNNPFEMIKQLQGLQSRVGEIQEKLKTIRVTGSAGGAWSPWR